MHRLLSGSTELEVIVKRQRLNSCIRCLLSDSTEVEMMVKRQRLSRCIHCLLSRSTEVEMMVKRQRLNSCMQCLFLRSTDVEVIVKRQRFSRCVDRLLSGSTGVGCELYADDNCDSSPCLNGATCSIGSASRVCSCAPGTPGCLLLFVSTMMMKLPAGIHAA